MKVPRLLLIAILASTLASNSFADSGDESRFPLIPAGEPSESGEVELQLVEASIDGLLERQVLRVGDVLLPGGEVVALDLERIDVERMNIGLHLNGRPTTHVLGALSLSVWSGKVRGSDDSEVALSFSRFGCHGWLRSEDQLVHLISEADPTDGWIGARTRWISDEALRAKTGPVDVVCANDELEKASGTTSSQIEPRSLSTSSGSQSVSLGVETYVASIAVESDYQYFQVFGDVNAASAYVVTLFAWVSNRYEIQIQTALTVPYLNFYTTPADPWTTPDTGGTCIDMIYEFQNAWMGNVPGGAAIGHYLSGANLGCGVAFIEGLCDPLENFSVSGNGNGQVQFPIAPSDANLDFYLISHELGHNFGAIHTHSYCPPIDECAPAAYFGPCQTQQACTYPGTLMSYCHGCGGFSNINTWFHAQSALDMRAWVETSGCLPTFCPTPSTYCTSQVNSDGCAPAIGWVGEPRLTGPDNFHVNLPDVPSGTNGLLFYGTAPDNIPFLGGTLCVAGPQTRTPVSNSGGVPGFPCGGSFDFFWSQAFSASQGLSAGTSVFAQYWYRDSGSATGVGLSDALEFTLCN